MTPMNQINDALQVYSMLMLGFALLMIVWTMAIEYKRS